MLAGRRIFEQRVRGQGRSQPHLQGAPDLAIEVVSESEIAWDLRQKVQDYLDDGSRAVWAFCPKLRVVAVYEIELA